MIRAHKISMVRQLELLARFNAYHAQLLILLRAEKRDRVWILHVSAITITTESETILPNARNALLASFALDTANTRQLSTSLNGKQSPSLRTTTTCFTIALLATNILIS